MPNTTRRLFRGFTLVRAALVCVLCACRTGAPTPAPASATVLGPAPQSHLRPAASVDLPRLAGKADMNLKISLSPFPNLPAADRIHLLGTSVGPVLVDAVKKRVVYGSGTQVTLTPLTDITLRAHPLQGGAPPVELLTRPSVVLGIATWDVGFRSDGSSMALMEEGFGGGNGIDVVTPGHSLLGAKTPVKDLWLAGQLNAPPYDHYTSPHFVRGPTEGRVPATAMKWGEPVFFSDVQTLEGLATHPIAVRCIEAMLIAGPGGLTLIYKALADGEPNDNEVNPGRLRAVRLDADRKPASPPVPIFPHTAVFGFDATPLADGVAVAAGTSTGLSVAVISNGPAGLEVLGRKEEPLQGKVESPSILAAGGKIHVAVLQGAAVLVGEVALGP